MSPQLRSLPFHRASVVLSLLSVGLLSSASASAEELAGAPSPSAPPNDLFELRLGMLSGLPDILAATVDVTAFRPFEFEGGLGGIPPGIPSDDGFGSFLFRVGYDVFRADSRRTQPQGWSFNVTPMAGVRYGNGGTFNGTAGGSPYSLGLNAVVVLDSVYWFAPHFGLGPQLTLGGIYWLSPGVREDHWNPDLRLTLGLAF